MPAASSTSVKVFASRFAWMIITWTSPPNPAKPSLLETEPPASEATNVPSPIGSLTVESPVITL